MNEQVGAARIGQWYQHLDKGEMFVVTGIDDRSGAIEIQTFDGDLDEIEAECLECTAAGVRRGIRRRDWTARHGSGRFRL